MKLSRDKTAVVVNEALTLAGIPPECFTYRLGNRSALEWVIDQYRVKTDKRSGITSDPNRADDPEYIVRLVGRIVTVSVETVKLVEQIAAVDIVASEGGDGARGRLTWVDFFGNRCAKAKNLSTCDSVGNVRAGSRAKAQSRKGPDRRWGFPTESTRTLLGRGRGLGDKV